jgi:hypothetical protein
LLCECNFFLICTSILYFGYNETWLYRDLLPKSIINSHIVTHVLKRKLTMLCGYQFPTKQNVVLLG